MIENMEINGYKCLKNIKLELSALNLFVGPNASGKSSVLQFILLLRQSVGGNGLVSRLDLSGSLYEGGLAIDVLHPEAERVIACSIKSDGELFNFRFSYDRERLQGNARSLDAEFKGKNIPSAYIGYPIPKEIIGDDFIYLNAERVSPKVSYPLSSDKKNIAGSLGKNGEYTTSFLAREASNVFIDEATSSSQLVERFVDAIKKIDGIDLSLNLRSSQGRLDLVANEILGWIIPGAKFDVRENGDSDSATLAFIRDPSLTQTKVRPTHIGFGLTYLLPIITGALLIGGSGILMVENPEAHLHPFSQSRIGVFLAVIASTGRQIFIETHSDHVVNGIRLAIKNECLPHERLRTFFFERPVNGTTAHVTTITCDSNAQMSRWPKGFFDQIEDDLFRL